MEREVYIVDTTLRDGLQSPRAVLGLPERIRIAHALAEAGVSCIEAATPAAGRIDRECIGRLTTELKSCRIIAWCRALTSDIIDAAGCGATAIHISFPISDQLLGALDKDVNWVFGQLADIVAFAKRHCHWVSVGAMDASRAPIKRLARFVHLAEQTGVGRIRIADTVGILTPRATMELVRRLSSTCNPGLLEFHAHNDLGMATANAISAVEAGVGAVSVTVNGIGERAGNASLEQVAVALYRCMRIRTSIKLSGLQQLCELVSQTTRLPIPPDKPITGVSTFTHQSGIHCRGLLRDSSSFEPFDPTATGHAASTMVVGPYSGASTVIGAMSKMRPGLKTKTARCVAARARIRSIELGRTLSTGEVADIAGSYEKPYHQ